MSDRMHVTVVEARLASCDHGLQKTEEYLY